MDEPFYYRRRVACLSLDDTAQLCGVLPKTVKKWDSQRAPEAVESLVKTIAGFPPGEAWIGWRFHNGTLWTPEGVPFRPGEIRAIPYHQAIISELKRNTGFAGRVNSDYSNVVPFTINKVLK